MMFIQLLLTLICAWGCIAKLNVYLHKDDTKFTVLSQINVKEGDSFDLDCDAVGEDAEKNEELMWSRFQRTENSSDSKIMQIPVHSENPSKLELRSIQLQDAGKYLCSDQNAEILKIVAINVMEAPPLQGAHRQVQSKLAFTNLNEGSEANPQLFIYILKGKLKELAPSTLSIDEGDSLTLFCEKKYQNGDVGFDVFWNKLEKEELETNKIFSAKKIGTQSPKLEIPSVRLSDEGRYLCAKSAENLFDVVFIKVTPKFIPVVGAGPPMTDEILGSTNDKLLIGIAADIAKIQKILTNIRAKLPPEAVLDSQ